MSERICIACKKPFVAEVANASSARHKPRKYQRCIECRTPKKEDPRRDADHRRTTRRRLTDGFDLINADGDDVPDHERWKQVER